MTKPTDFSRRFVAGALASAGLGSLFTPKAGRAQTTAPAAAPLPPPLSAYSKLPAIQHVALSPDGKRVAMVMSKNGERVIYDYDLTTKKAAAAVIEGDKLRYVMWADNSHVLVVTSATERYYGSTYEQSYGLIMDLPAGKRLQMYANISGVPSSVVTGDFYRVKMDGVYRVTASGFKLPEGMGIAEGGSHHTETYNRCLYAFNTTTSHPLRLDEDSRPVQEWVVKPDGHVAARSEFDDDTKLWTLRVKTEKGWSTVYSVKAPLDMPSLKGLGRDGESILIRINGGDDAGRYFEVSTTGTGTLAPLELKGNDNYPIHSELTSALVGFGNSGPVETWVFYDEVMGRLPRLINKALPNRKNTLLATAENARQVLILSEGDGDSGTYYFFDFSEGAYKEIGSSYPDLPGDWVAEKQYISYKAADGLEIPAYVTLPPDRDAKNIALVVLPHGGPQSYDDSGFDWLSQSIASRGYVVLQPNFRGSAGYGDTFTAAGYGEWGRKMQSDLSDGVRHLVKQGMVDPKRVAIAGASYGGYAALAGVTLDTSVYNCAVAIAGVSDLKAMQEWELVENSGAKRDSTTMLYWKRFMGDASKLDEVSPVKHVDAVKAPVLLIHGKDDTVVPFEQSQKFYDAMKKAGKPIELVAMQQEDHWLSREPTRIQTVEAMVGFLVKNNPPV